MKVAALVLIGGLVLAGCSGSGARARTCEVMSPASLDVPTTQNDQRVEANATGEPYGKGHNQQNCP